MKCSYYPASAGIATMVLAIGLSGQAFAQATNEQAANIQLGIRSASVVASLNKARSETIQNGAAQNPAESHSIPVKNVSPEIMAWWLDGEHNPEPLEFATSRKNREAIGDSLVDANGYGNYIKSPIGDIRIKTNRAPKSGQFHLDFRFDGVTSIVPDPEKPLSALRVTGTAKGAADVAKMVASFDTPIPQIEVEAKVVALSPEDLKGFTIENVSPIHQEGNKDAKETGASVGYVRRDYDAHLTELVQQHKAKIIHQWEFAPLNHLTATISETEFSPVVIASTGKGEEYKPIDPAVQNTLASNLWLSSASIFNVTSEVNNDQNITLILEPAHIVQLTANAQQPNEAVLLKNKQNPGTIVNVQDGGSVALMGLSPSLFSSAFNPDSDSTKTGETLKPGDTTKDSNIVMFVTAHILRSHRLFAHSLETPPAHVETH